MSRNNTVSQALRAGKLYLKQCGIEQYGLDAEILLRQITGLSRTALFTKGEQVLSDSQDSQYDLLLKERAKGKPIQYITGECEFMALPFLVEEGVLIPRPDTEILVEEALSFFQPGQTVHIMDVGTGSGCIAVSLAWHSQEKGCNCICYGIDKSPQALEVAKRNAQRNGVADKISFILSDLFQNVPEVLAGSLDMLVSNPPYIPAGEISGLMREVRDYEPHAALDGGEDGLMFYRNITAEGKRYLKNDAFLFFEIGYNQGKAVSAILAENGFIDIAVKKDLAGHDRVVYGRVSGT